MFRAFFCGFGFKSVPFVAALTYSCWDCCNRSFCHVCHPEWKREGGGMQSKLFLIVTCGLWCPERLCHCLYCPIRSKTSWVEGSQVIVAGWRERNITICLIIFNNRLEKGHWHWTDILQLHFCFALHSVFVTVTGNSAFFFSPPSVSVF